jgi:hypothetical protein
MGSGEIELATEWDQYDEKNITLIPKAVVGIEPT